MIETAGTLIIYLLFYLLVILAFSVADRSGSEGLSRVAICIAIIVMVCFSALRDTRVGTDTYFLIKYYFEDPVTYESFRAILTRFSVQPGAVFYFITAKLLHIAGLGHVTYFGIMDFLTVVPVTIAAYMRRKKVPMAATMAIFLLLYYQLSFNWIRQSIAAAVLLLAVVLFWEKKNPILVVVTVLLSILFHSSAVIGVSIFAVACLLASIQKSRNRILIICAALFIIIVVMLNWEAVALSMIRAGILPSSYQYYVDTFSGNYPTEHENWFRIGKKTYGEYFFRAAFAFLPFIIVKGSGVSLQEERKVFSFCTMCALISFVLYSTIFFGLHTAYGNRITYYADMMNVIYFGFLFYRNKEYGNGTISRSGILVLFLCCAYNLWLYYILGWHDTVPYYFSF